MTDTLATRIHAQIVALAERAASFSRDADTDCGHCMDCTSCAWADAGKHITELAEEVHRQIAAAQQTEDEPRPGFREYLRAKKAARAAQADEGQDPRAVCTCGHTRAEHIAVSARLLCDACDPDSTDNRVCDGFQEL